MRNFVVQVIAAEGEQKASRALKEASEVIAESSSALQLRYLQVSWADFDKARTMSLCFMMPYMIPKLIQYGIYANVVYYSTLMQLTTTLQVVQYYAKLMQYTMLHKCSIQRYINVVYNATLMQYTMLHQCSILHYSNVVYYDMQVVWYATLMQQHITLLQIVQYAMLMQYKAI